MTDPLLPGSMLGVFGGGQLGRMFAVAAQRMGYHVTVYSEGADEPAAQVADRHVQASFDDLAQVQLFARSVDAATFEFENIPAATAEAAAQHIPLRPSGTLLHTTQNRIREKTALRGLGLPVTDFAVLEQEADLEPARQQLPEDGGVLKTASWGYDGKGQVRVARAADLGSAWAELDRQPAVLEAWVPFEREISVVAARGVDGEVVSYEPFENQHRNHILDLTLWPARIAPGIRAQAQELARAVMTGLEVVGVSCIEMFVLPDGELLINEIAPRPHNSGHLTIEAHHSSQFEQQVRALCGLPLGSVDARLPAAAMANLLGDLWNDGTPDWTEILRQPGIHLHLYGKREARPGRKMGHLTTIAATVEEAAERLAQARSRLTPNIPVQ